MSDEVFARLNAVEQETLSNKLNLAGHERECAIRYGHINESVAGMKENVNGIRKDMRTVAYAGAGIGLAVLAFLVKLVFFPAVKL